MQQTCRSQKQLSDRVGGSKAINQGSNPTQVTMEFPYNENARRKNVARKMSEDAFNRQRAAEIEEIKEDATIIDVEYLEENAPGAEEQRQGIIRRLIYVLENELEMDHEDVTNGYKEVHDEDMPEEAEEKLKAEAEQKMEVAKAKWERMRLHELYRVLAEWYREGEI